MTAPSLRSAPLPLSGRRVMLTRPLEQAGDFEERIRTLGGEPLLAPAISIVDPASSDEADAALARFAEYQCVAFTSANAVRAVARRIERLGLSAEAVRRPAIAAVGAGTAEALRTAIRPADVVSQLHHAAALADAIAARGARDVLFPKGESARETLPASLRARGVRVDETVVYRTLPGGGVGDAARAIVEGTVDAVLFASPSAVRFVAEAVRGAARADAERPAVFCLGPVTAAEARERGLAPVAMPATFTQDDLIEEVARWFAARRTRLP